MFENPREQKLGSRSLPLGPGLHFFVGSVWLCSAFSHRR